MGKANSFHVDFQKKTDLSDQIKTLVIAGHSTYVISVALGIPKRDVIEEVIIQNLSLNLSDDYSVSIWCDEELLLFSKRAQKQAEKAIEEIQNYYTAFFLKKESSRRTSSDNLTHLGDYVTNYPYLISEFNSVDRSWWAERYPFLTLYVHAL